MVLREVERSRCGPQARGGGISRRARVLAQTRGGWSMPVDRRSGAQRFETESRGCVGSSTVATMVRSTVWSVPEQNEQSPPVRERWACPMDSPEASRQPSAQHIGSVPATARKLTMRPRTAQRRIPGQYSMRRRPGRDSSDHHCAGRDPPPAWRYLWKATRTRVGSSTQLRQRMRRPRLPPTDGIMAAFVMKVRDLVRLLEADGWHHVKTG